MSQNQIQPDDPRLTAYALGELDPTEQESLEQMLFDSPEAQAAVREIRELAGLLATELRQEPVPGLTAEQRTAILAAGQVAAETVHEPATPVVNHSAEIAVLLGLPDPPRPKQLRSSSRSVRQFASLAAIVALIVVVAVMIPPTRSHTDLPMILAQQRSDLGESQSLGAQFDFAGQDGERPGLDLAGITNGVVRLREGSEPLLGMDPVVAGGGTASSSTTPFASGLEPSQKFADHEQQVTTSAAISSKSAAYGRGLAVSANKPNVPQDGAPSRNYYYTPEPEGKPASSSVAEEMPRAGKPVTTGRHVADGRGAAMGGRGLDRSGPVTAPMQLGRSDSTDRYSTVDRGRPGASGSAENKAISVDELRTHVRNSLFRAEGLSQTDPAAARALIENAETAVKNSTGVDGKATGQLLKSLEKSRNYILTLAAKAGVPELARRKSEIEETIKLEQRTEIRIHQPGEKEARLAQLSEEPARRAIRP